MNSRTATERDENTDRYDDSHNLRYGVVQGEVEVGHTPDETTVTITKFDDRYKLSMATVYGMDATIHFHDISYSYGDGTLWFKKHIGDETVTTGCIDWYLLSPRANFGLVGEWFRDQLDLEQYRTGAKCPECGGEILNDHMVSGCENLECDVFFEGVPDDSWDAVDTPQGGDE